MITKPLLWGGQGPYKDCGATDDDDDSSRQPLWCLQQAAVDLI
jgi:hypothetical protein